MDTPLPVRLDDLIAHINHQHPDGDTLQQLSDAVLIAERLGEQADHLIGHFVDQARRSGASWTDIGQYMGVSKQAAQKRFVAKHTTMDSPEAEAAMFSRFTDRARIVLDKAQLVARNASNDQVDTPHLLLGLTEEREGLACVVLDSLQAPIKGIRADAKDRIGPAAEIKTGVIPFSPQARTVLKLTLREALGLGHNYVGTEHLLLGILSEGGVAAAILNEHGVTRDTAKDRVVEELDKLLRKLKKPS